MPSTSTLTRQNLLNSYFSPLHIVEAGKQKISFFCNAPLPNYFLQCQMIAILPKEATQEVPLRSMYGYRCSWHGHRCFLAALVYLTGKNTRSVKLSRSVDGGFDKKAKLREKQDDQSRAT
jgi:hypothetical protein